jgi:hypothetical protein
MRCATYLRDAVSRRLMSDVPLGVLLSGGVDSGALLGLMREVGADGVATFTMGFRDEVYDERRWARLLAHRHAADHHEVVVGREDFLAALPRLSWYRDEPIAEPSEIPLLLLAECAGQHVKVVLSGDGGDELFGGYPKYRAERLLRAGGPACAAALRLVARALATRPSHRRLDRAVERMRIRDLQEEIQPLDPGFPVGRPIVLYQGGIYARNRAFRESIRALTFLDDAALVILGFGREDDLELIRQWAHEEGVADRVHLPATAVVRRARTHRTSRHGGDRLDPRDRSRNLHGRHE